MNRMHDPWQEWTSGILQSDLTPTTSRGLAAAYAITFARTADLALFAPITDANVVAIQHGNAARAALEQEIDRRLPPGTKTWATMLAETLWGKSDLTLHKLLKDLHIARLADHQSNDPRDLQSDAIVGAAEKYRELTGPDLPHDRDWFVARLAGQIAALLEFNAVRAARDGCREALRKRRSQGRRGIEVDIDLAETVNQVASPSDLDSTLDVNQFLKLVGKRLGAKAVTYFMAKMTDKSDRDAAKAAGIDERTGRRFRARAVHLLSLFQK